MWVTCGKYALGVCPGDKLMNTWDLIKRQLEAKLSTDSYQNWISGTEFSHIQNNTLVVVVPNEETRVWMDTEYAPLVTSILHDMRAGVSAVVYQLPQNGRGGDGGSKDDLFNFNSPRTQLNPRYTFDNFVVGSCNQFAHAAAQSVATSPSRRYNPLFIYSGVGMGKTHLMHAVGRSLMDNYAGMRIIYTSSERFVNEMVTCIRLDRMTHFHSFYRNADVLLMDDVHILGGKERTQEEFFHTFNELYDHQKQIVISSDSTPKEIPGLVERLRSRFEWGLMVDMQPPDLETKMAILDKKAESEGVKLPEDVRIFMATKTKSNVRELEGGLVKLIAYSSLTGTPINLQMSQQVLKHLVHVQDRRVTIDAIQKAVAERFQMKQAQLKEKSNTKNVVYPRQIAMYLVKELTAASLPEIGRAFGGKHHTTVLHSINKIEQARHTDLELNRMLHSL